MEKQVRQSLKHKRKESQENHDWKNKNPKIHCYNCVFDKNCKGLCSYLSIKKYNAMRRADRVNRGFGKLRPKPIELKALRYKTK